MSEALSSEPIQPELPFDGAPKPPPSSRPEDPPPVLRLVQEPDEFPQPLLVQLVSHVHTLSWTRVRTMLAPAGRYSLQLSRATLPLLFQDLGRRLATAVHVVGFPAVVMRTAIQLTLAYRAGLAIEEAVFLRADDPAGFVVYEAPPRMGTAAAVAFVPALILTALALICLGPALAPRAVLHLPATWVTWVQLWLGLSFAAHALPSHEEAGSVAEQARAGAGQADPVALMWLLPSHAAALISRPGGVLPAVLGASATIWLARALFQIQV